VYLLEFTNDLNSDKKSLAQTKKRNGLSEGELNP
jgi:hypothetical protein